MSSNVLDDYSLLLGGEQRVQSACYWSSTASRIDDGNTRRWRALRFRLKRLGIVRHNYDFPFWFA